MVLCCRLFCNFNNEPIPPKLFCILSKLLGLVFRNLKLFKMWRKLVREFTECSILRGKAARLNTTWKSSCSICFWWGYLPLPPIYNTKNISGSLSVHFASVSAGVCVFFSFLDRGRYLNKITYNLQMKQVSFQSEISTIWIKVTPTFRK